MLPVTVPKSPAFTLKSRTRVSGRDEEKVTAGNGLVRCWAVPPALSVPFSFNNLVTATHFTETEFSQNKMTQFNHGGTDKGF